MKFLGMKPGLEMVKQKRLKQETTPKILILTQGSSMQGHNG